MKIFSELKKNLKNDFSNLTPVKVALLGDNPTQLLTIALRGTGYDMGFDLQIWEAGFAQIERQVFDQASEFYAYQPDVVIIFHSSHHLLQKYNKLNPEDYSSLAEERLKQVENLTAAINSGLTAKIIHYNFPEINDGVFGSYANKTQSSFLFQTRKLNYGLMEYAMNKAGFYICDLAAVQIQCGKATLFHPSVYINTGMVLSIDILPEVAARTVEVIAGMYGKFKKCLVFDLDNTIWGGVIGDDGIENIQLGGLGIGKAFTELQHWLKKLKNRGIILAACSKNTEAIAMEAFDQHPDMVLKVEDVAVFAINWDNKVDNLLHIQSILNIGFDSMVFLDDNPFERDMVRQNIPEITVPELPSDPADYLEYLYSLNLFETASLSNEDAGRTKLYQTESKRTAEKQSFVNEDDFLKSLNMVSVVEPFTNFNIPRVAQLTQRSNQFNLRTVRYTEAELKKLAKSEQVFSFSFGLEDKFGDNALIAVAILKKENDDTLFIDTWLMSCRVLKRGMENFVLNELIDAAAKIGIKYLKGEYLPTVKNGIVKEHYANLGFTEQDGYWTIPVDGYQTKKTFISRK
ncbi:HAD family hydrolase [Mucilaginibacter sp.]|uniref:HAD-IIIC family phosphatase n=1 Tax=Mucilaginibacter sp. TaxID=1882438 RepID=UPI002600217A|nr:HAD-IIIC family phosphatase [Mucilaginibacter sp.]